MSLRLHRATSPTTPTKPSHTEPAAPTAPIDPFTQPSKGTPWCDCGQNHQLTRPLLPSVIEDLYGELRDRLLHSEIIDIAAYLWQYVSVCAFFTGSVDDAARRINGTVAPDYPLNVGCAILQEFCNHWSGCPDEGSKATTPRHGRVKCPPGLHRRLARPGTP